MKNERIWQILAAIAIALLAIQVFFPRDRLEAPDLLPRAYGDDVIESRSSDIYTTSPDGATLYRWSSNGQFRSKETAR